MGDFHKKLLNKKLKCDLYIFNSTKVAVLGLVLMFYLDLRTRFTIQQQTENVLDVSQIVLQLLVQKGPLKVTLLGKYRLSDRRALYRVESSCNPL